MKMKGNETGNMVLRRSKIIVYKFLNENLNLDTKGAKE